MRGHLSATALSLTVTATLLAACSSSEGLATRPKAPEMRVAASAINSPTGVIGKETVTGLVDQIFSTDDLLHRAGIQQPIGQAMAALKAGSARESAGPPVATPGLEIEALSEPQAFGINGAGWLEMTRICDGWGPAPAPDPGNGSMRVYAGFTESGIDPVVWGTLRACRFPVTVASTVHQVELDGGASDAALSVYIGDSISFTGIELAPIIAVVDLRATVDGTAAALRTTLRFDPRDRSFQFVLPLPDGSLVAQVSGVDTFSLRGANGTVGCDRGKRVCKTADDQVFKF
jgi:hypothetical protein